MYRLLVFSIFLVISACTKSAQPKTYQRLVTNTHDILYKVIKNDQSISVVGGFVWSHGYEKTYDLALNLISTDTFSDKGLFDVCVTSSGDKIAVGTDGYLFEKKKNELQWKFHRLTNWDILDHVFETATGFIAYGGKAYETGYIYHLNHDFETDSILYFGHEISKIFHNDSGRLISVGWGQIDVSDDGGYSWQTLDIKGDFFVSGLFINEKTGFTIGANGTILKTIDGGSSWSIHNSKIGGASFSSFRSIVYIDDTLFILGNRGKLWQSNDNGENWTLIELPDAIDIYDLVKSENQSYLLVGSSGTFAKITL